MWKASFRNSFKQLKTCSVMVTTSIICRKLVSFQCVVFDSSDERILLDNKLFSQFIRTNRAIEPILIKKPFWPTFFISCENYAYPDSLGSDAHYKGVSSARCSDMLRKQRAERNAAENRYVSFCFVLSRMITWFERPLICQRWQSELRQCMHGLAWNMKLIYIWHAEACTLCCNAG